VKNSNFLPLVANLTDEIVSYAEIDDTSILLVFPQLENTTTFLLELFQVYLPDIARGLFPFSTQFAWLRDEMYQLPGQARLLSDKRLLEQEYAER